MLPSLLLLSLAAMVVYLLRQQRTARELEDLRMAMRRVEATCLEGARVEAQLANLRQVQIATEKTVELGASAVRTVHLGIASIPFGVLEAIPATRSTTRLVRDIHDQISNVVYDTITGTNRLVGSALRQGLPKSPPRGGDKPPQDEDGGGGP